MVERPVIKDSRFSDLSKDPRFKKLSKSKSKVAIDERFSKVFNDQHFQSEKRVDKYGRRSKANVDTENLKKYYRLHDDELSEKQSSFPSNAEENIPAVYDPARGEGIIDHSDDSSTDISDVEAIGQDDEEVDLEDVLDKKQIPMGTETHRLACVNADWDHVKAVDLLALFSSFKPTNGSIVSVCIYPSEFGKERLAEEEKYGPSKDIFVPKRQTPDDHEKEESDSFGSDESEGDVEEIYKDFLDGKGKVKRMNKSDSELEDTSDIDGITNEELQQELFADHEQQGKKKRDEYDNEKLRRYQLERLRYYYAVIECDSIRTASAIYHACDGSEMGISSNYIDLRFIPNEVSFEGDLSYDEARHVPVSYSAPRYVTKALQHSKVDLTWDIDDDDRVRVMRRRFDREALKDMDFSAFLASSSSDEDDDDAHEDKKMTKAENKEKYRQALLNNDSENVFSKNDKRDEDMVITFRSGLADVASQLVENRKDRKKMEDATVWEKYQMEKKEKKKLKKKMIAQSENMQDEENDMRSENLENDPFFSEAMKEYEHEFEDPKNLEKSKKKAKKGSVKEESIEAKKEEKQRKRKEIAELKLLMMDERGNGANDKDDDNDSDENDSKTGKKSKRSKRKEKLEKKKNGLGVDVDVNDARFAAVFDSADFAIDPTHPQFKDTNAMKKLITERHKRVLEKPDHVAKKPKQEDQELNLLVSKLKQQAGSKKRRI